MTHDFAISLAESHRASDLPFWEECYRKAFPTMLGMFDHRDDGDHQRNGIDRTITLASSKQIRIDEKVRGRNKKTGVVYHDIAIEEWSDVDRQKPGWAIKPLQCDYIAYAIAPIGRCYLLPVEQLQLAWRNYGEFWKSQSEHRRDNPRIANVLAHNYCERTNRSWKTQSWGIPVDALFRAIGSVLRISFERVDVYGDLT